jgi:hypothetical protein
VTQRFWLLRLVPNDDEERPRAIGQRTLDDIGEAASSLSRRDKSLSVEILLKGFRFARVPNNFLEQMVGKPVLSVPVLLTDIHEDGLTIAQESRCTLSVLPR